MPHVLFYIAFPTTFGQDGELFLLPGRALEALNSSASMTVGGIQQVNLFLLHIHDTKASVIAFQLVIVQNI